MNTIRKVVVCLATTALTVTLSVGFSSTANAAVTIDPTPWKLRTPALTEDYNFPRAMLTSLRAPDKDPLGSNDWACKPTAAHPEPVILIHGTWENAYDNWNGLSPILKAQGYCVFALNYGNSTGVRGINATADMVASAGEIATYVKKVAATTGAAKVALIGHSQGGAQARYVANLLLPKGLVDKVIAIAPTNHATTLSGITTLADKIGVKQFGFTVLNAVKMPSAVQQATPTAPFYVNVNGKGETIPGIDYTVIATKYDEVSTPYTQAFLTAAPGTTVDNITIQNKCVLDLSEHLSLSYSKNVAQIVLNKLDPQHPHATLCYVQAPLTGGTGLL